MPDCSVEPIELIDLFAIYSIIVEMAGDCQCEREVDEDKDGYRDKDGDGDKDGN